MNITFLGAAHEVTGSCTLIEVNGKNILVDCGMEQGKDIFQNQAIPVSPAEIDCVFLTHAHIDHSGNLPLLYKNGFRGTVYATEATCQLCDIMLRDSAGIQQFEAEWQNRKAKRAGGEEYLPIYDMADAEGLLRRMRPCAYDAVIQALNEVDVRFTNVGHLLGAAAVELWLREGETVRKVVFSGDIGNKDRPFLRDPAPVAEADYLVIESTYGDREHEKAGVDYVSALSEHIQRTFDRGGNVVIPAFAVGRSQEILYFLRQIKQENRITGHDNFPVYLDSPLANEATSVLLQCDTAIFNDQTRALIGKGMNPIFFPDLRMAVTSEESKAINNDPIPKVIISASGMCEAGRIRHHLKHNLWRPESLVLFAGYQTAGTLGRILRDGAKMVKLFGEDVAVRAEVGSLADTSGHADRSGLVHWLAGFTKKPGTVFVNHGEDGTCDAFAKYIQEGYGYNAVVPYSGACYDLKTGGVLVAAQGEPVAKAASHKASRATEAWTRLVTAAERLVSVAKGCKNMGNKDLAKFESQIIKLCDKWGR